MPSTALQTLTPRHTAGRTSNQSGATTTPFREQKSPSPNLSKEATHSVSKAKQQHQATHQTVGFFFASHITHRQINNFSVDYGNNLCDYSPNAAHKPRQPEATTANRYDSAPKAAEREGRKHEPWASAKTSECSPSSDTGRKPLATGAKPKPCAPGLWFYGRKHSLTWTVRESPASSPPLKSNAHREWAFLRLLLETLACITFMQAKLLTGSICKQKTHQNKLEP